MAENSSRGSIYYGQTTYTNGNGTNYPKKSFLGTLQQKLQSVRLPERLAKDIIGTNCHHICGKAEITGHLQAPQVKED